VNTRPAILPRPPRFPLLLLLALLMSGCYSLQAAQPVSTDPVWRLAGTFNGWSTAKEAWRLTRLPDGNYFIETWLDAGHHEFKFVRDGDWSIEHLGAAGAAGQLVQPGGNIVLDFASRRLVSILLDPIHKQWRLQRPVVTEPVAIVDIVGQPRAGVPLTLDASSSLLPVGEAIKEIRVVSRGPGEVNVQDDAGHPDRAIVVPGQPGHVELDVSIRCGQWSKPTRIAFDVTERISAIASGVPGGSIDFTPIEGDMVWGAVAQAPSTAVMTFKIHDPRHRGSVIALAHPAQPGETFAIVYDRRVGKAQAIPGRFSLASEEGQAQLVEARHEVVDTFWHDPRRPDHFEPISAGLGLVELTAITPPRTPELTVVLTTASGSQRRIPMAPVDAHPDQSVWKARLTAPRGATRLTYSIESPGRTAGQSGVISRQFDVSIDPFFETPDWAKRAVWYQIFPERFRNGQKANDPYGNRVFPMAWNAPWNELAPGEWQAWQERVRAAGDNPDKYDRQKTGQPGGRFYNVVWDRRYGGDLQGVIEKLDYLRELGINSIYLNPIFEAVSMHKYDTSDFRHVDDNFGGDTRPPESWQPDPDESYHDPDSWKWTGADRTFLKLLDEAHQRDMHVIIDGVFNHVGRNHPAFQDVVKHGKASPFANWFVAEFDARGRLQSWTAWDGPSGWLPKLAQNPDGSLVAPVMQHIFDITRRWMDPDGDGDPSDGIDGWRLDVPLDVGDPFWRQWCAYVRSINPNAYIVAEIWTDGEAQPRLRGDMFDAQMHYPFAGAVIDWLANDPDVSARDLATRLDAAFGNEATATQMVQQDLFASHDTDRLVSRLFNARPGFTFDSRNRPQDGEEYNEAKPDAHAYALNRLALVMQATYIGAPMIYYGEEIGMHGADDPSCRKPRPWPDLPEMVDPDDRPDAELEAFYRKWLNLRNQSDVLQLGLVRHLDSGRPDVFAFERRVNESGLLVVINRGDSSYNVSALGGPYANSTAIVAPLDASVVEAAAP